MPQDVANGCNTPPAGRQPWARRPCGLRAAWPCCRMLLERCHMKRRPPEPHRLAAAVSSAVAVLPWYRRHQLRPRASMARCLMRTLGVLCVPSGCVRELSARCPEDDPSVARSRARCLSGPGRLTCVAGCMWCAFQVQSWPHASMVSVAVATPRGDPCGGVPGGTRPDLPRLPQIYHRHKCTCFEIFISYDNFLA